MGLIKSDFLSYTDGNNLLSPAPSGPTSGRASDNGPMFTSEYFIMLKKNNALLTADVADFEARISACIDVNGLLNRAPVWTDSDQEGPDDYYAVSNACIELGITDIPRKFVKCLFKYFGFLNNNSPGAMTGSAFLARQPQMVAAIVSAAYPSMTNPLHYLVRLAAFPLYLYSAVVIATSDTGDPSDSNSRRLAWHLGNCVSKVSLLNWLAYKLWTARLYSYYPTGMKGVAAIYYQPGGEGANPYSAWWIT